MLDTIWDTIKSLLGLNPDDLNAGQMALRTVLTFAITIAILRRGDKRLFGKGTMFDTVVAIMIGSIMSRAITGSSPLFATWVAGGVLVALHWLVAKLAFRLDWFGPLVKGNPELLIDQGRIRWDQMKESGVTRKDLDQAMRSEGIQPDPPLVDRAVLERDGSISVLPAEQRKEPSIVDISVQRGVQTVRIALE